MLLVELEGLAAVASVVETGVELHEIASFQVERPAKISCVLQVIIVR